MQVHNRVLEILEEPMSHVYVITTRRTPWFVCRSIFVCLPDSNLYQEVAKRPSGSVGIETSWRGKGEKMTSLAGAIVIDLVILKDTHRLQEQNRMAVLWALKLLFHLFKMLQSLMHFWVNLWARSWFRNWDLFQIFFV